VSGEDVVGRYWFHVPHVGRLMLFARTTWGIVVLVLVPATWVPGWSVRTLLGELGVTNE